jgi:YHS domain-containing protein
MVRILLLGILLIIAARLFWRMMDGVLEGMSGRLPRGVNPNIKLRRDPICGTLVVPDSSLALTADGVTRYFCSEKCRDEYLAR